MEMRHLYIRGYSSLLQRLYLYYERRVDCTTLRLGAKPSSISLRRKFRNLMVALWTRPRQK